MRLLLDGDQASNNGNWQWIASVGVDPAAARSGASTTRLCQQERFDPDGRYVRRYVPELAQVPGSSTWLSRGACPRRCRNRPGAGSGGTTRGRSWIIARPG